MLTPQNILSDIPLGELFQAYSYLTTYFEGVKMEAPDLERSFIEVINGESELRFTEFGLTKRRFALGFIEVVNRLQETQRQEAAALRASALIIRGGTDKSGWEENIELKLLPGETVCIVGPTGAGKSRLLADIECLAEGDTVTRRHVLLEGEDLPPDYRYSNTGVIAQLSQHMSFVIESPADQFIAMHAESAGRRDVQAAVAAVLENANRLSGEAFAPDTPLAQLSGGQSSALMIADTALISRAPIILIDEIENAGIDKNRALSLLCGNGKLVVISTHDPCTALQCDKRIVIANGGISGVFARSAEDRENAALLSQIEATLGSVREKLRHGETVGRLGPEDFFKEVRNG